MGTLKPGSHHEVLRSVCPRLCGPCPPPTTPLPSPPSSTDSHTEPWPPLGMPCLTLLPTSHMPTPQLSTTPSTPDSSTQLLSPTSTMPQVRCAWKQGHAVTLVHQKNETSFLEDV